MLFALQLNDQTFLKRPGSDTCRIKILDFSENFLHFIDVSLDILTESQIINNRLQIPSDITIILYTANKLLPDDFFGAHPV